MPDTSLRASARRLGSVVIVSAALAILAACGSSSPTPVPSGAACLAATTGNHVDLHAQNLKFSTACIAAAAGAPIVIVFTNDEAMPHDVAVYTDSSKSHQLVKGDIITGPNASTTVTVPAQQAGQLYFECTVHPEQMNGSIVVTAAPASSASQ